MSDALDAASAYLGGADPAVIEQLHARYLRDPASVDPSWRRIFAGSAGSDSAPGAAVAPDDAGIPAESAPESTPALGCPRPARPPRPRSVPTPTGRSRPRRSIPSAR